MLLDPNLQGSGISMGNVGANQGYGPPGRGTNLGDQFMRNQGSVVDRSRSRGATSRGGGIRGQSVVSGQYLPDGVEMGRAQQRDERASLFDVVHGTSQSRALGDARCKFTPDCICLFIVLQRPALRTMEECRQPLIKRAPTGSTRIKCCEGSELVQLTRIRKKRIAGRTMHCFSEIWRLLSSSTTRRRDQTGLRTSTWIEKSSATSCMPKLLPQDRKQNRS